MYSSLKTSIFGPENKKSTHSDSSWETKENPATNSKQGSIRDSKDNSGFSNPRKALTANTDIELMVSKKPVPAKILSEIKNLEQNHNFETYKADPVINDLFKDIKQILRNKEDSSLVKNQIKELIVKIVDNSIQEIFQKISQIDTSSSFEEIKNKFGIYLHEYIESCFSLVYEVQKIILDETLEKPEVLQADFLKTIQTLKEVSSDITNKYLNKLTDIFNLIPDRKTGLADSKTLKKSITEDTWPNIRKLVISSHFGILDSKLVKTIFNSGSDLNKADENSLYTSLAFLSNLQKIVQGTVLINNGSSNDTNEINIGSIPEELAQKALNLYTRSIIKKVDLTHDHIPDSSQKDILDSLNNDKSNLRQFFNKCGRNEASSFKQINDLEKLSIWDSLEIDSKHELEIIKSIWIPAGTVSKLLGRTQAETLPGGYKVEGTPLLNFLFNDDDARRNFERITLELSALAGIDAISTYKGWKKDDHSLLENYESYQKNSIPWIKDFYAERYTAMKDLISKEKSEIHISSAVEYISHLALELTNSTKLFTPDDYLKRYSAKPYIEELFKFMFNSTRTGILPLNILLAQSWGPKESSILSQPEVKELNELIEFIKTESLIKDDKGDIQYAPIGHSKAIDETFTRLSKSLSNTGFLLNHADLIIKFLKKSIEAVLETKQHDKDSAEFDILKSHNIILATWLFYILVKFLPEKTNDLEALRIKTKIVGLMFDERLRTNEVIPKTLYNKLKMQALGLTDDGIHLDSKQKGTFRSLFEELDSRINAIAEGKANKNSLKDLIYIYAELEKNMFHNPGTLSAITEILKDKQNVHQLVGLNKAITKVLDVDPDLIVNYAKGTKDQKIKIAVANSLLEKASNLANLLLKQNLNQYGELEIKDNDQQAIFYAIKTLNYMNQLGYLLNDYNDKFLSLKTSLFLEQNNNSNKEQQIKQIQVNIDLIEIFLNQKVNLLIANDRNIDPQKEAFPDQLNAKNILIGLLKKFSHSLRPAAGLTFEWRDLNNIVKLRERSLHYSKESFKSSQNSRSLVS